MKTSINTIWNFTGRIILVLSTIIFIPYYIKQLGIESYALIGFYATIIGTLAIMDFGLSTTLNRELARSQAINNSNENKFSLIFTLEVIYWSIGVILSIAIISLSNFIAIHWLTSNTLPISTIENCVKLMGLVIAFQWPIDLYVGGLTGIEKHALQNIITIIFTLFRSGGVIIFFIFVKPSIELFFIWQAISCLLYIVILRFYLFISISNEKYKLRFSKQHLLSVWKFTSGMTSISIVTFFLTQSDKIIVSKMLPLSVFAYYTLAFTIANGMTLATAPFGTTIFPRFSNLIALKEKSELLDLYNKTCKNVAYILFPLGLFVVFFMRDIIFVWTHNLKMANGTSNLAVLLTIGSICNCLMLIPYQMLLAYGMTTFAFYQNLLAAIFIIPILLVSINFFGVLGATFGWLIINVSYVAISLPILHKKLKLGSIYKWYLNNLVYPFFKSLIIVLLCKFAIIYLFNNVQASLWMLFGIFLTVFSISILTNKEYRNILFIYQQKARSKWNYR